MELDAVMLSRIQFAFTVMFHYLFPPTSIGLGVLLVAMEGLYLKTGNQVYKAMARFWTSVFALVFVLGAATGLVMEFQFGTNWSAYSRFVGDVFGPALAAEGVFAFFLESCFLGVMVFGWDRVSKRTHFLSTVLVACGALLSAVWIIVANSWQQTPAGFQLVEQNGMVRAEITQFWAVVFNPSSMIRLSHVLFGAFLQGGFFVMGVAAFYLIWGRHLEFAKRSFLIALAMSGLAGLAELGTGHLSACNVAACQPAKLAAMEGVFKTAAWTPAYVFGIPDSQAECVRFGLPIPGLLSLMVHFDPETPVAGFDMLSAQAGPLNAAGRPALPENKPLPKAYWPPLLITFSTFHIMVALGMAFIGLCALAGALWWFGKLFEWLWVTWIFIPAAVLPVIANQLGWVTAEVGRQPWIVYRRLLTSQGVSHSVSTGEALTSLLLMIGIYGVLLLAFLYVLGRKIMRGPEEEHGPQ